MDKSKPFTSNLKDFTLSNVKDVCLEWKNKFTQNIQSVCQTLSKAVSHIVRVFTFPLSRPAIQITRPRGSQPESRLARQSVDQHCHYFQIH